MCDHENSDKSTCSQSPEDMEAEAEATNQSDDYGVGVAKSEAASEELSNPSDSADGVTVQSLDQGTEGNLSPDEAKTDPPPVPAPRQSFHSTDQQPLLPNKEEVKMETSELSDNSSTHSPPGFLYKVHITYKYCGGFFVLFFSAFHKLCISQFKTRPGVKEN